MSNKLTLSFSIITILAFAVISTTVISSLSSTQPALAQRFRDSEEETSSSSIDESEQDNGGGDSSSSSDDSTDVASSSDSSDSRDNGDNADNRDRFKAPPNTPDRHVCRTGDVTADNDRPDRFTLFSTCTEVTGTIAIDEGIQRIDGDQKYLISLDDQYKHLLGKNDMEGHNGLLVLEVITRDQGSPYIDHPKEGDRVRVLGAYVNDGKWNELHPVYLLQVLNNEDNRDIPTSSSSTDNSDNRDSTGDNTDRRDNNYDSDYL